MGKFRTKKFWISLAGIVVMLLQLFGLEVDAPYVTEVVSAVCAVCVLVGLLDGGKDGEAQQENTQELLDEQKQSADNENSEQNE